MPRFLFLILILVMTLSANAQTAQHPTQEGLRPTDGNGLLDYCGKLVNYFDGSERDWSTSELLKIGWCLGWVQATVEHFQLMQTFMTKEGSATNQGLLGICIPFNVPNAQVMRVSVKWLRDHPERLHENLAVLSVEILTSAFPCQAPDSAKK